MKKVNPTRLKSNVIFSFNGKKYKWIDKGECWRQLAYENGELVAYDDKNLIKIFLGEKVEIRDENN